MQVVLREDVKALGRRGDIVNAADGYARNYLIPRGIAQVASDGVKREAETLRKSREAQDQKQREFARDIASQLSGKTITVKARARKDGKLFGSVNANEIVSALKAQFGLEIDKHIVTVDHIKTAGTYNVPLQLHTEVEVQVAVEVAAL